MTLDVRADFPAANRPFQSPHTGRTMDLVFLDHAASTHPPTPVLDEVQRFLSQAYANVHRGAHTLSYVSTERFEDVRMKVRGFVGARSDQEVLFTQNTTEALTLGAHLMAHVERPTLVTILEHHSNDLPHRARGEVVHSDCLPSGELDMEDFETKLRDHRPKLVAVTAASNVTGITTPLADVIERSHDAGAKVLVDGAQALAHLPLSLSKLGDGGPDMFAAAGHKAYAPFGAAFLVASRELVDEAEPFRPGGGTVKFVGDDDVMWTTGVERHEGGTPNVPGTVAMGAALDYLRGHGMANVRRHELDLLRKVLDGLAEIDGVTFYGDAPVDRRVGTVTFNVRDVPHSLVSTVLDREFGIATRNGCFCAHPYLTRLLQIADPEPLRQHLRDGGSTSEPDFPGAVRASLGIYNNEADVDRFLEAVQIVAKRGWHGSYAFEDVEGWVTKG